MGFKDTGKPQFLQSSVAKNVNVSMKLVAKAWKLLLKQKKFIISMTSGTMASEGLEAPRISEEVILNHENGGKRWPGQHFPHFGLGTRGQANFFQLFHESLRKFYKSRK